MKKRLPVSVLSISVAVFVGFMPHSSDPVRFVLMMVLILIFFYSIYPFVPKPLFFSAFVFTIAAMPFLYFHPSREGVQVQPTPTPDIESAYRDAQKEYALGHFERTIEILEPFRGTKAFKVEQLDKTYYLLGLAYLSLPQPRCRDVFDLRPSISQYSLEESLQRKCKEVSCPQCRGIGKVL